MQEGPINTLALNRDCNKVVVTGRNVFKVCEIKDTGFVERDNIRTGKNSNLNFSCNDASWNPVDEQWLATAATNGAVVLWNIQKSIKLKQETVYNDHKRTVNKVTFHGSEQNMLLSGSQDGTMKYFDIRMKAAVMTFVSNAESVRDVQFNPYQCFSFAAVSENGTVQLWDLRRQDRSEKQFTAHSGPVFACDWHPENKSWLATAGRDKAVKVWDLGYRPVLEYTVTTMASVGRIKWRPQRMHHIASCALVIDSVIHVWDVRRPYIPHASFNDHKDITTGIAWRGSPDVLLSTSKDSYLIQHVIADAERPMEKANPICVTYNSKGSLTLAAVDKNSKKSKILTLKSKSESEDYPAVRCSIYVFENEKPTPGQVFRDCARHYWLQTTTGKSLGEICDHNAVVASNAGRIQIATIWRVVKLLFGFSGLELTSTSAVTHQSGNVSFPNQQATQQSETLVNGSGSNNSNSAPTSNSNERGVSDTSGGVSEEAESEVEDIDSQQQQQQQQQSNQMDWILPSEAFQLRHEIKDRSPPPEHFPSRCFAGTRIEAQMVEVEDTTSALLCLPGSSSSLGTTCWSGVSNAVEMVYHMAEDGDVQTAVSLILVLGDRIRHMLNESAVEHWILAYIDSLSRCRLWNTAALVVKLSQCESVQLRFDVYPTHCNLCSRALQRRGWLCDSCKTITNTCSLCHLVVRGLYVWCRGCSHGGHLLHIREWFSRNSACPTGCGHVCEFD
ncbi:hypothetical protein DAPPUDRAFT_52862 [Daphnia pulex]|uniref:GATOR2 complex protein WDR24 n=1 Tax=Daphnia pulex TaxID=6669 RepID=E9GN97_DAPPU|nr:hypothetical protein DAPPUDRAFT_52862 [Daphnia pulex]|eukprot:EFX79073.1 hypothetical protein DAPPUDRAFT_52862 [Daphnia pulex]